MTIKKLALAFGLAAVAATAPVTISGVGSDAGGLVRLNAACGQATECFSSVNFICSTHNKDWEGYKCTQGCGPAEE